LLGGSLSLSPFFGDCFEPAAFFAAVFALALALMLGPESDSVLFLCFAFGWASSSGDS
jgi:hypothetical protein